MSSDERARRPWRPVTRRQALSMLGAGVAAVVAAACTRSLRTPGATSSPSSARGASSTGGSAPTVDCVLSPEMTEGPYYIDGEAVRSDITEDRQGVPLRLDLTVADAATCRPLPKAAVEVWHADAVGNYSGFNATASNTTFLRGVQVADADGRVTFHTIYPGWYMGRATHIHLKVHVGGSTVHTGQLFFDDAVNDTVYGRSPYSEHTGQRMLNDQDGIYGSGGAESTLRIAERGDGFVGTITLGVQSS
jgi:protocatechuate 3,4-dioxygenase beta subunit